MGFPIFANICSDILPILIINFAMSIAAVRDSIDSFLQALGLLPQPQSNARDVVPLGNLEDSNLGSSLLPPSLSEEICSALPVTNYDPDLSQTINFGDPLCPVCLSDFQQHDEIRILPLCQHVFHKGCLDPWLDHQQTTCPSCRSSLVPEEVVKTQRRREQELAEELIFWFSSFHGSGLQGLWWQI